MLWVVSFHSCPVINRFRFATGNGKRAERFSSFSSSRYFFIYAGNQLANIVQAGDFVCVELAAKFLFQRNE